MAGATWVSSQGEGAGDGNCCGQAAILARSQQVSSTLFSLQVSHGLGRAKQHADKRSDKVRWSWVRSVSWSKVSYGTSMMRISFGFAGAVQLAFGIGLAFEVSPGGGEEVSGAGDFSAAQW